MAESVTTETSTTTSTVASTTTSTVPAIDVHQRVRLYLEESITAVVEEFVDGRLAEAGESASYSVVVNLGADPVVELSVPSQEAADVIDEAVGRVTRLDNAAIYHLFGGSNVPRVSGDQTYASLSLPTVFLSWTGILEDLRAVLSEMGFPSATVARMENTRAVDGTLTAEGDGFVASWTYHPDDGLAVIIERR